MVTRGQSIRAPSFPTDRTLDLACLRLVLTSVRVQAHLSRYLTCELLWVVDGFFVIYTGIQGGFDQLWISGAGSAEEPGIL
jgi:hypothetical protein